MDVQGNTCLPSQPIATWPCTSYGVIRIIRFLLVFIVLPHLCISLVEAAPVESANNVSVFDNPALLHHPGNQQNIIRQYRLLARCSDKLVRLQKGRHIRANGRRKSRDSVLTVGATDLYGNVRIQSERYKRYICFDKRGILKSMEKGNHEGCKFIEILTRDGYTKFQSLWNTDLYIGFRRSGQPIRQGKRTKRDKCYQFLKLDVHHQPRTGRRLWRDRPSRKPDKT